jgi:hypothetical protein
MMYSSRPCHTIVQLMQALCDPSRMLGIAVVAVHVSVCGPVRSTVMLGFVLVPLCPCSDRGCIFLHVTNHTRINALLFGSGLGCFSLFTLLGCFSLVSVLGCFSLPASDLSADSVSSELSKAFCPRLLQAASCGRMAANISEIPEGITIEVRGFVVFEWRCPAGDICGKNQRLMYKKADRANAITAGAWHLYDKSKHSGSTTWQDALIIAEEGVTERVYQCEIYLDENGTEMQPPEDGEPDEDDGFIGDVGSYCGKATGDYDGNVGGYGSYGGGYDSGYVSGYGSGYGGDSGGSGGGKEKGRGGGCWKQGGCIGGGGRMRHSKGGGCGKKGDGGRNRSRSRSRHNRSGDLSSSSTALVPIIGQRSSLSDESIKARLDELLANVTRAVQSADHCSTSAWDAHKSFAIEALALMNCKHILERLRRS